MSLRGAIYENFMAGCVGKQVRIYVKDIPDICGELVDCSHDVVLIRTTDGTDLLIDTDVVIGIGASNL